jgi:N-methylhydantoinase A
MLQTNVRHDLTQTFYQTMQATTREDLEGVYGQLEGQGRAVLHSEEVPDEHMGFLRTADMRYTGQEYSVNVPVSFEKGEDGLEALTTRFHNAYKTHYGHSTPGAPIEFVNLRVAAFGKLERHTARFLLVEEEQSYDTSTRDVIFQGRAVQTKFYRRERLPTDMDLAGPHVIEEETATTVVPPGWTSRVDKLGNIIVTREEG